MHANLFLAAYAAGVTVATVSDEGRDAFYRFGETVTELLKLSALFVFGILISPDILVGSAINVYIFATLVLVVARPLALGGALLGSGLSLNERAAAAWFGPKGFASAVYGLFVLRSDLAMAETLFHLIAVVIAGSMIAHSSTDTLIAHWFRESEEAEPYQAAPGQQWGAEG